MKKTSGAVLGRLIARLGLRSGRRRRVFVDDRPTDVNMVVVVPDLMKEGTEGKRTKPNPKGNECGRPQGFAARTHVFTTNTNRLGLPSISPRFRYSDVNSSAKRALAYLPKKTFRQLWRGRRALLVLSHMRSGSTLLSRILVSNPNVCGIGELHRRYADSGDFLGLYLSLLRRKGRTALTAPFVLDKILHDAYLPNETVLSDPRLKILFLLREPVPSISSLVLRTAHDNAWMREFASPERATEYYVARLERLQTYAQTAAESGQPPLLVTYEELIEDTERVLGWLAESLRLVKGLSEHYQVDKYTGVRGIGDYSDYIRAGRIVRDRDEETIFFPPERAEFLSEAYARTLRNMERTCMRPLEACSKQA